MSFAAMAGWQAWLLILGAAGAAAWLFYVKVRPPKINVPSLLLWRRVLDHTRELTLWERIRKAVSLAVTVTIALGLAIALTRPGPSTSGAGGHAGTVGRVLIVIDSSWSMAARTSHGGTRWTRALADAHAIAAASANGEVALATTADGLIEAPTSDLALIDTAIDALTPAGGETGDFPRVAGVSAVHFITDGAVSRTLDPSVIVHTVFDAAPNVAVTALELRPAANAGSAGEAYLEVANYAPTPQAVRLVLTRGSATIVDQTSTMNAGEVARRSVPLDVEGDPQLRARVSAPENVLAADDEADAWISESSPILVAIVSDQPAVLSGLLQQAPNLRTAIVKPAQYRPGREDVVVFDRWLPETAPKRPALVVAPTSAEWLGKSGVDERQPKWTSVASHPVLMGVDPATIDIKKSRAFEGSDLTVLARTEQGNPLLAVSDRPDRRAVVLTFGAPDSNLAFAPAFPVLMENAIEWLARPVDESTRRPGPIVLTSGTTKVTAPDNAVVALNHVGTSVIAKLTQPGFYTIEAGGARTTVGVNVGSPEVSNLQRSSLSGREGGVVTSETGSSHAWWLYAVIVAFVLVAIEWWTWQRRITV